MKYKKGDRVKYVSGNWGDKETNPLWGGECGKIAGTISSKTEFSYRVEWENKLTNSSYTDDDLELVRINVWKGKER